MSQPHRENGTWSLLVASNPSLDDDSCGDPRKAVQPRVFGSTSNWDEEERGA